MKRQRYVWIGVGGILLLNIVLIYFGIKESERFFSINIMSVLSLDVSVILSVYAVQSLASKRRGFDFVVKMLDVIVEDLGKPELLDHDKNAKAQLLQRYLSNRLKYLEKACPAIVKKDLSYIRESYEGIQNFYGDHASAQNNDPYYEREKTNIITKIAKIQLCLYGFEVYDEEK
mgnify:CR=1 FL=1